MEKNRLARGQGRRETNVLICIICTFLNFLPSVCITYYKNKLLKSQKEVDF